jgi:solute:Na+ symporter, SSS family
MEPILNPAQAMEPILNSAQAQATFGMIDWLVVLLYFIVITGVGVMAGKAQKSKRDFFLGGRDLSWWAVGLSIIATETSALTFIGVPAMAFGALKVVNSAAGEPVFHVEGGDMFFINLIIGYVIGRVIIAWKIVPMYFTGDVYTPFQLLKRAFGQQTRYISAALSLVGMALGAGVRVYVTAIPVTIVVNTVFPGFPIWAAIVVIMLVSLVYTAIGGIKAVVWTEMLQYFIFIGGGLFAVFYIPTLLTGDMAAPSGATGWGAVTEVASDHLAFWNSGIASGTDVATGESLGFIGWLGAQISEIFSGKFNLIMGIFPQTLGIILAFGFDQLNVQRVLSCRNVKEGRKAIVLSAILIFPQFVLFLFIGVVLFAFYKISNFSFSPDLMPWDPKSVDAVTGLGSPKGDFVFPIFIVTHLPPVARGFLVAGILAAAMSSVASALSAMGSITVMDFFRPLTKAKEGDKKELLLSRLVTVVAGVILGVIAFLCKEQDLILNLAFKLAGITGGAILGAFVFGMWKKGGHGLPVILGMIVSFIFMVIYNMLRGRGIININWPWDATIGMVVCLVVAWVVSLGMPHVEGRDISQQEADGEV